MLITNKLYLLGSPYVISVKKVKIMFNHLIKFKNRISVVNSSTIFVNRGGLEPLDWQRCFRGSAANEIGNTDSGNDGSIFL